MKIWGKCDAMQQSCVLILSGVSMPVGLWIKILQVPLKSGLCSILALQEIASCVPSCGAVWFWSYIKMKRLVR
jgi:hypothetical protein